MLPAALGVFLTSGIAALVYQVVWQRMLAIFSGADVHSATIVVAAFMAGLGCGSLAGGHVADRVSPVRALTLFAGAELAIAVFGFASEALLYGVVYERVGPLGLGLPTTAAVLFIALLWPTFFMGVSLPLLAKGLTSEIGKAGSVIGWLYAVNTLGAALGALAATWWLVPHFGLGGAAQTAACLNLVCAAVAVPLARTCRTPSATVQAVPANNGSSRSQRHETLRFGAWATAFALAGFVALSIEIVWFRLLGVMLKSTAFTFGTLLAWYLIGLGTGAAIGSAVARRVRRPAMGFFLLQAAAGAYTAVSLSWLISRLDDTPALIGYWRYFGQYDPLDVRSSVGQLRAGAWPADFLRLYVLLPLALIVPPTLLSGWSFPLLQRVVQTDLRLVGRRVGALLAANIVGSTLGAFLTGLGLLRWLGTAGTLRLLVALSGIFAVLAVRQGVAASSRTVGTVAYTAAAAAVLLLALQIPESAVLWARLHGTTPLRIIHAEDGSGVSVIRAERDFSRVTFFLNGLGQSSFPYGGIHTVLGALPALIHAHPREAAVIGLGSGDTLYALAVRRELERITSIEIVSPQLDTLRELARWHPAPSLLALFADRRIEHVVGDGRLYIRRARRKYDIIEADALRPTGAYSGTLYSEEYFRVLLDHLNPGGLAITWAPTERVGRTFLRVFPYVWQHRDILMGSNAPIEVDRDLIRERLSDPAIVEHYSAAGIDIRELLSPFIAGGWRTFDPSHNRSDLSDVNTDLHPRDEFDIP